MRAERVLKTLCSSLVVAAVAGCLKHKPVAVYVGQNLDDEVPYAEPGQRLEWRVQSPQSPAFRIDPDEGLCDSKAHLIASLKQPAYCNVAPHQTYPSGAQMNFYHYRVVPLEGAAQAEDLVKGAASPPEPDARHSSNSGPGPVFAMRVGSCGSCTSSGHIRKVVPPVQIASSPTYIDLQCGANGLIANENSPTVSPQSRITWSNLQNIVVNWTVTFAENEICKTDSGQPISAANDRCTVQTSVSGTHTYTAILYKSDGSVLCKGNPSINVQGQSTQGPQ